MESTLQSNYQSKPKCDDAFKRFLENLTDGVWIDLLYPTKQSKTEWTLNNTVDYNICRFNLGQLVNCLLLWPNQKKTSNSQFPQTYHRAIAGKHNMFPTSLYPLEASLYSAANVDCQISTPFLVFRRMLFKRQTQSGVLVRKSPN